MTRYNGDFVRMHKDDYPTPTWASLAVVPWLKRRGIATVYEAAPGDGQMVNAFRAAGLRVLHHEPPFDFLQIEPEDLPDDVWCVATNPPYGEPNSIMAVRFIEHSLSLMAPRRGVVAMFLDADFDFGVTRRHLLELQPFARQVKIMKRVNFFAPKPGEKPKNGKENFAWFVWDFQHAGPATIGYFHYDDIAAAPDAFGIGDISKIDLMARGRPWPLETHDHA
jgi:hypothetical protein